MLESHRKVDQNWCSYFRCRGIHLVPWLKNIMTQHMSYLISVSVNVTISYYIIVHFFLLYPAVLYHVIISYQPINIHEDKISWLSYTGPLLCGMVSSFNPIYALREHLQCFSKILDSSTGRVVDGSSRRCEFKSCSSEHLPSWH